MHLTLLGGAESSGFVRDLADLLTEGDQLSVVFNTARDMWAHGLKRSPDADALVTALDRQSPRSPTFAVAEEIAGLGVEPSWTRPSDQDVALQVVRTELMTAGFSLTEVTAAIAARRGISTRLLPMTNDRVEQHVVTDEPTGTRAIHVEEFLARRSDGVARDLVLVADDWKASTEAVDAIENADVIIFGPASLSLTLLSLLRTPGLVEAVAASAAPVIDVHVVDPAPESLASHARNVELLFDLAIKAEPDPASVLASAKALV
ncbi:MAG: 2-phospho-L-lactate transferase CofD family protein [Aeromicrobium sp.]